MQDQYDESRLTNLRFKLINIHNNEIYELYPVYENLAKLVDFLILEKNNDYCCENELFFTKIEDIKKHYFVNNIVSIG